MQSFGGSASAFSKRPSSMGETGSRASFCPRIDLFSVFFHPPVPIDLSLWFFFVRKWFGLCVEAEGMTKEDFQFKQPPIHW